MSVPIAVPTSWLKYSSLNLKLLFFRINWIDSKMKAFGNLEFTDVPCFSSQKFIACNPNSWGMFVYRLFTSNVHITVLSFAVRLHFWRKSMLSLM